MRYIADLHIHSPYSRATSKASDLPGLAAWAQVKGIQVMGTGDFTHPGWFSQLAEQLIPAEPGFFRLKNEETSPALPGVTPAGTPVRFVLSAEISSIYKRHGQVRKVHNILYAPDLAAAARITAKLAAIGNIESDGRPILGLDSRDLLEILLDNAPDGFLVPAHIWTPWFSLFGSKSGFNTIEECFGDLAGHIFALETGLSSDPAMNRLVSALDRFALISNSDCHSPAKLGREANLLDTDFNYFALRDALKNPNAGGFAATVEFFPEEGKYHCDGHRKCKVCLEPRETRELAAICPVCGRPLTVGVLHRVMELADRDQPHYPAGAPAVHSIIPLPEVLGELLDAGPATKGVMANYGRIIARFGSEFNVLLTAPLDEIRAFSPLLGEAVARIRENRVIRQPGYDGEFGVIRVFEKGERQRLAGQSSMFANPKGRKKKAPVKPDPTLFAAPPVPALPAASDRQLNPEQQAAISASNGKILVAAGPGTGKTFTLVARLEHLLRSRDIPAACYAAITFTNRAATEIRQRLQRDIGTTATPVFVGTFHRFCLDWLRQSQPDLLVIGDEERIRLLRRLFPDLPHHAQSTLRFELADYLGELAFGTSASHDPSPAIRQYLNELERRQALDLDLVIPAFVQRLTCDSSFRRHVHDRVRVLMVDEFQDVNAAQYALVELLGETADIFAIGDPNQAIYGFRGSKLDFFFRFQKRPDTRTMALIRNYRSAPEIITAATAVISHNARRNDAMLVPHSNTHGRLEWYRAPTVAAEAEHIVQRIEELMGGVSHYSMHTGRGGDEQSIRSFGDFAVLYRLAQQAEPIGEALSRRGIPFQLIGATPFYMRPPLRPVYGMLRLAAGESTPAEYLDLLKRQKGIGAATLSRLDDHLALRCDDFLPITLALDLPATAKHAVTGLSRQVLRTGELAGREGMAAAVADLFAFCAIDPDAPDAMRLKALATLFGQDLAGLANHLRLNSQASVYDERADSVALMTMHGAKGLEFPVVFLTGLEEGIIPCTTGAKACDPEEERRLFYVSLTRTRDLACLSMADNRTVHGKNLRQLPSHLVAEVPAQLLTRVAHQRRTTKSPSATQMKLF